MASIQQADGNYGTARVEFAYADQHYNFRLNPQNITTTTPHRTTVVKTQSQYVVEDFNDDVQTVVISGTTGGPTGRFKGYDSIINLWNFLDAYANANVSYGQKPKEYLTFYNHTDGYAWTTVLGPAGYKIERDVSHPLMWNYEINLVVLGMAGNTIDNSQISGGEVSTTDKNKRPDVSNSSRGGALTGTTPQTSDKLIYGPPAPEAKRIQATQVPTVKKTTKSTSTSRKAGFDVNTVTNEYSQAGTLRAMQTLGGK